MAGDLLKQIGLVLGVDFSDVTSADQATEKLTKHFADQDAQAKKLADGQKVLARALAEVTKGQQLSAAEASKLQDGMEKLARRNQDSAKQSKLSAAALIDWEQRANLAKMAALNLRGALQSTSPEHAKLIGHVAGGADALADGVQAMQKYATATTTAGKVMAGLPVIGQIVSVALEACAAALEHINSETNEYIANANKRHFEGLRGLTRQQEQLNFAIEAGWDGFKEGADFAENYAKALKYLQDSGLTGLKTGAAEAQVEIRKLSEVLDELGVVSSDDVAVKAQQLGEALELLQAQGLSEEEAVGRLKDGLEDLAEGVSQLTEGEIPLHAEALVELAAEYDNTTESVEKLTSAADTQIAAIRDRLTPANQELLDVMANLDGQTEETRVAMAESIEWTQQQAAAYEEAAKQAEAVTTANEEVAQSTVAVVAAEQQAADMRAEAAMGNLESLLNESQGKVNSGPPAVPGGFTPAIGSGMDIRDPSLVAESLAKMGVTANVMANPSGPALEGFGTPLDGGSGSVLDDLAANSTVMEDQQGSDVYSYAKGAGKSRGGSGVTNGLGNGTLPTDRPMNADLAAILQSESAAGGGSAPVITNDLLAKILNQLEYGNPKK